MTQATAANEQDAPNPTRENLLNSAEKLFWFKGHKNTSIDDIASGAGQSKGAFFHYFKSKKEITILALNSYAENELFTPMEKHFSQNPTIKDALLSWAFQMYSDCGKRHYKGGCMLGNMALELADHDEEMRAELSKLTLEWENRLVGLLKDNARSGTALMEPRQFARVVTSSIQGLMMSIKTHKDQRRAAREFQALAELFERLIKD